MAELRMVSMAADHRLYIDEDPLETKGELILKKDFASRTFTIELSEKKEFCIEKTVSLHTSRETPYPNAVWKQKRQ